MQYHGSSFSYENSTDMRTAVNRLQELIDLLYPDPKPEVFTLRSFEFRYQRYTLRDKKEMYPAVIKVIEQSQRLNRALNDYSQCGLNEFYAGLIFLYWGDCYAAEKQFEAARRYWSFVYEPAAQSLADLGRGLAQQFTHHDESALICYGRATQSLERLPTHVPQAQQRFREELGQYLQQLQAKLHQKLFAVVTPDDKPEGMAADSAEAAEEAHTAPPPDTAVSPEPEPEPETAVADVPPPLVGLPNQPHTPAPLPPWTNLSHDPMPIEGHKKMDDAYRWYQVERRRNDSFMPQIQLNDWVLVHLRPSDTDLAPSEGRPIVTVCESASGGSIYLKPHALEGTNARQRIYLRPLTTPVGKFVRDPATGQIYFPATEEDITDLARLIGVVVGLWRTAPQVVQDTL